MDKMLLYIALTGLVNLLTGIITVRLAKGKPEPPQVPCDTCKHLVIKDETLGYWCKFPGEMFVNKFDHAPEYCKEWEQRGGGDVDG